MKRTIGRPAAAFFCLLTAGCATTYQHVVENGYKYEWESTRRPPEVAGCITARVESQRPWRAMQRTLDDRGSIEVLIGSGSEGVAAVAQLRPFPYGTRVQSWITSRAVITRDIWHDQFFGGC